MALLFATRVEAAGLSSNYSFDQLWKQIPLIATTTTNTINYLAVDRRCPACRPRTSNYYQVAAAVLRRSGCTRSFPVAAPHRSDCSRRRQAAPADTYQTLSPTVPATARRSPWSRTSCPDACCTSDPGSISSVRRSFRYSAASVCELGRRGRPGCAISTGYCWLRPCACPVTSAWHCISADCPPARRTWGQHRSCAFRPLSWWETRGSTARESPSVSGIEVRWDDITVNKQTIIINMMLDVWTEHFKHLMVIVNSLVNSATMYSCL